MPEPRCWTRTLAIDFGLRVRAGVELNDRHDGCCRKPLSASLCQRSRRPSSDVGPFRLAGIGQEALLDDLVGQLGDLGV